MAKKKSKLVKIPQGALFTSMMNDFGLSMPMSMTGFKICGSCPFRFAGCIISVTKNSPKDSIYRMVRDRKYPVTFSGKGIELRKSLAKSLCIRKELPLASQGLAWMDQKFLEAAEEGLGDYVPPHKSKQES